MARLIDTSVFIELERKGLFLATLEAMASPEPIALASITASELLIGVHRSASPPRRQRRLEFVEAVLSGVPVVSFDLATAETHARLLVELSAIGQPIGANDLLIAATAITHGYELLTHDLRHFG